MTPKQTVDEIAEKVYSLAREGSARDYFVDNITHLCTMAEKYRNHVQQCLDDPELRIDTKLYEKRSRLQPRLHALYERLDVASKPWRSRLNWRIIRNCLTRRHACAGGKQTVERIQRIIKKAEGQYERLSNEVDNPPTPECERSSLLCRDDWLYLRLTIPEPYCPYWIKPSPVNPLLWFDIFPDWAKREPNNDEWLLMRDCFLLAAIHDRIFHDPTDKKSYSHDSIFPEQYDDKCFKRDEFAGAVFHHYAKFDTEKDSNERLSDLDLAFGRVEEGFKKAGSGQPAKTQEQKDESRKHTDADDLSWQAQAIARLWEHRDWSIEKVAKTVGKTRQALYDDTDVNQAIKARKIQKQAPSTLPHGEKDDETGRIEAW